MDTRNRLNRWTVGMAASAMVVALGGSAEAASAGRWSVQAVGVDGTVVPVASVAARASSDCAVVVGGGKGPVADCMALLGTDARVELDGDYMALLGTDARAPGDLLRDCMALLGSDAKQNLDQANCMALLGSDARLASDGSDIALLGSDARIVSSGEGIALLGSDARAVVDGDRIALLGTDARMATDGSYIALLGTDARVAGFAFVGEGALEGRAAFLTFDALKGGAAFQAGAAQTLAAEALLGLLDAGFALANVDLAALNAAADRQARALKGDAVTLAHTAASQAADQFDAGACGKGFAGDLCRALN